MLKGTIQAPPSSGFLGGSVIIVGILMLSLAMVLPASLGKPTAAIFLFLVLGAVVSKSIYAIHFSVFGCFWLLFFLELPELRTWPFKILLPLSSYAFLIGIIAPLRRAVTWAHVGHFGRDIRLLVLITATISSTALVIWYVETKPDMSSHIELIPDVPLWSLPFLALGFGLTNAAIEEIIFRGIILESVDSAIGPKNFSIVIQAVLFGAMHYLEGVPNGALGFLMTFLYGLLLGTIRRRAQGLLAPWIAHIAADMTIFCILAVLLLKT